MNERSQPPLSLALTTCPSPLALLREEVSRLQEEVHLLRQMKEMLMKDLEESQGGKSSEVLGREAGAESMSNHPRLFRGSASSISTGANLDAQWPRPPDTDAQGWRQEARPGQRAAARWEVALRPYTQRWV